MQLEHVYIFPINQTRECKYKWKRIITLSWMDVNRRKKKDRTNKRRKERENEKVGGYCIRIDRFLECHYVQLRYIHIFSELAYNNPKGSTTTWQSTLITYSWLEYCTERTFLKKKRRRESMIILNRRWLEINKMGKNNDEIIRNGNNRKYTFDFITKA